MTPCEIPERYSRQVRFPGIGQDGQRKLLASKVTLVGCGALGTVLANALVRAGVGHLRLIDRDFIETNNLQRQILFDEADVAANLPKAEAAARKLRVINSGVTVEPVVNRELIYIDVWENTYRKIKIAGLKGKVDCPCCGRRQFEWLDGAHGAQTTSLCGRNAVQVSHRVAGKLDFATMARDLGVMGKVSFNKFMLKFDVDDYQFTVFPDGRAIIKGTDDADKAKTLYAKYVGH